MKWTDKQENAFSLRNREILVSAAAGSGKTAVMVERILQLVTEEPLVDIDRLLIVTFTKKAAESMKAKIRKELEKRLRENPENEHLQKQMLLINHAHISTIDSFCSFIVKNYFYLTEDVSSNYRIGNKNELKLIEEDVLKSVLEDEYEKASESFLEFVDYFAPGKNDNALESLITSLYRYSQSHQNPEAWLKSCVGLYENFTGNVGEISELIINIINTYVENSIQIIEEAKDIASGFGGPFRYLNNFESDIELLESVLNETDLRKCMDIIAGIKFSTLSRKTDDSVLPELKELCKNKRNTVKKKIKELSGLIAYDSFENICEEIYACRNQVKELVRVTIRYSKELLAYKKKKNVYEHSDIAHIALDILRSNDGHAKLQLSNLFDEIFIDEYQDSNRLQEELLYSIAKEINGARRVFMVGDVKQSIYSFRMACPDLFISKLESFTEEDSPAQKVFLSNNFRSRLQVVEFVNFIFNNLMTKSICGIDYDDSQRLVYSAQYELEKSDDYLPEVLHYSISEENQNAYETEAYMIGQRIHELVNGEQPLFITDKASGEKRKLEYKDICIIVRTQKDVATHIKKVLEDEFSIPVLANSAESFFESFEISLVLNYLRILDNPYNDYPLGVILLSPIAGLTPAELSKIRLINKKATLYESLLAYSEDSEILAKISSFLEKYEKLRAKLSYMSIHELLWEIYDSCGIEPFVAALPAGEHRVRNLSRFVAYAIEFESTDYRSLFDFLRYVEKIIELDLDSNDSVGEAVADNAVKIMTMHKSKGLEFPVVFLAGLTKSFNTQDEKSSVLLHPDLGVGLEYVNVQERSRRRTLIKRLIAKQMHIDKIGEEIRVLYVAMTRAEEKLIIACCHKPEDTIDVSESDALKSFGYFDILKASGFWGWLKYLLREYNGLFKVKEYFAEDIIKMHEDNITRRNTESGYATPVIENSDISEDLKERLEFSYESKLENLFKKISVTFLKEQYNFKAEDSEEELCEQLVKEEVEFPTIPDFIKETKGLSGAQRGLLYHSILEHWDYSLEPDSESVMKLASGLLESTIISEDEYQIIEPKKILSFLNSDIGCRMKAASDNNTLVREGAFSVILDHRDKGFEFIEEDVLLQGIIDAYFEEEDGLVIVDYKTDNLPDGKLEHLVDKYAMQLICYKYALEKLTCKKVKEVWIYSVYADDSIRIDS